MADMIVIRSPRTMTAPKPGTDNIIYADPRILVNVRGDDLVTDYAIGDPVSTFVARGSGRAEELVFKASANWNLPTLAKDIASGHHFLNFDGTQQIANVSGTTQFATVRPAPLTYIAVTKIDQFSATTSARVIGGTGPTGNILYGSMSPQGSGNARMVYAGGGTDLVRNILEGNSWAVHTMVVAGANSKAKTGTREIVSAPTLGASGNAGIKLGGNTSNSSTTGLRGGIFEAILINGALTDEEILKWHDFLSKKYGIAI